MLPALVRQARRGVELSARWRWRAPGVAVDCNKDGREASRRRTAKARYLALEVTAGITRFFSLSKYWHNRAKRRYCSSPRVARFRRPCRVRQASRAVVRGTSVVYSRPPLLRRFRRRFSL